MNKRKVSSYIPGVPSAFYVSRLYKKSYDFNSNLSDQQCVFVYLTDVY